MKCSSITGPEGCSHASIFGGFQGWAEQPHNWPDLMLAKGLPWAGGWTAYFQESPSKQHFNGPYVNATDLVFKLVSSTWKKKPNPPSWEWIRSCRITELGKFFISEKWKHSIIYGTLSVMVEEGLIGFFILARSCVQKHFINWWPSLTQFYWWITNWVPVLNDT